MLLYIAIWKLNTDFYVFVADCVACPDPGEPRWVCLLGLLVPVKYKHE